MCSRDGEPPRHWYSPTTFEGNAKSPTDRFLVIGQDTLLTIGAGGLTGAQGLFPVHFEDGTLVVDAARLVNVMRTS